MNGGGASSPCSRLLKSCSPAGLNDGQNAASGTMLSNKEAARREKETEEARKSGLLPAAKDEEGKDINPHIPQYIAKAPWYLNDRQPSLKHQRSALYGGNHSTGSSSLNYWYKKGQIEEETTPLKKFRKGACANCGAITHQTKDCMERPRRLGAKWTNKNIAKDEYLPESDTTLGLGFEAKRDRWGGYDSSTFKFLQDDHAQMEDIAKLKRISDLKRQIQNSAVGSRVRRKLYRQLIRLDETLETPEEIAKELADHASSDEAEVSETDDVKIGDFDQTNAPMGSKDDRTRTTTMNLRIREDTAKYLMNLDPESAFYDPKTRSMRDNPLEGLSGDVLDRILYRGDNAIRNSGESFKVQEFELFSWEARKHGTELHPQALPTQLELAYRGIESRRENSLMERRKGLIDRYGGEEHLVTEMPEDVVGAKVDAFVEYTPQGEVKKLISKLIVRSKYLEDVYESGHSEIWGSWFDKSKSQWGYKCCKSRVRFTPCPNI